MIRRAAVVTASLALTLAACHRAPAKAPAPAPAQAAQPTSRGFGAGTPNTEESDSDKPSKDKAPPLPAAWAARPTPTGGLAIYVDDGQAPRTIVPSSSLAEPQPLAKVLSSQPNAPVGARSVLVHGESGDLWLVAADLAHVQLRLNHRGQVKLEPIDAPAPRGGGGKPSAPPAHARRDNELRAVAWIEVRTTGSPRVDAEPR